MTKRPSLPSTQQLLGFIALAVFGVLYTIFGGLGRNAVLKSNQCKMTYTSRDRKFVPVRTSIAGFQLWKYSNHRNKKLNKQPVLFIPGHRGTVDQVRSLSSAMHNGDNFFQYFSLDFKEADSAHHGSSIFTQAAFVNDAVTKIGILYRAMYPKEQVPKVMLVGHSIGGMVARTAVLLDNHPKCAVGDIVLLSTPSLRPPYSVDSSMDALYGAVNKAWANSFLNESKACRISARIADQRQYAEYINDKQHGIGEISSSSRGEESSGSKVKKATTAAAVGKEGSDSSRSGEKEQEKEEEEGGGKGGVYNKDSPYVDAEDRSFADRKVIFNNSDLITADWDCPVCAAKIRVISITGGIIDNLVPAHHTRLEALAPVPRNLTLERKGSQKSLDTKNKNKNSSDSSSSSKDKDSSSGISGISGMLHSLLQSPLNIASRVAKLLQEWSPLSATTPGPATKNANASISGDEAALANGSADDNTSSSSSGSNKESETAALSTSISEESKRCDSNGENGACSAAAVPPDAPSNLPSSPKSMYETVTLSVWQADMAPYSEALHLSVRSSQLQSVGFAIDHTAILWCHQLISTVTSAMRTLARTPYGETDLSAMSGLFPTRPEYQSNYSSSGVDPLAGVSGGKYIKPIANLLARNVSRGIWDLAAIGEISQLQQSSPYGAIQAVAVDFFSNHLIKIAICYVMISCLCLSVPLFRALSDNKRRHFSGGVASEFELLMPWQHWHFAIIDPALHAAAGLVLPADLADRVTSPISILASLAAAVFVPKVIFDLYFSPVLFHQRYGPLLNWVAAYGLALTVKAVLIPVIHCLRMASSLVAVVVIFLLRWTMWNKYVRRAFRRSVKYLGKHVVPKLGLPKSLFSAHVIGSSVAVAVVLAGTVVGGIHAWPRVSGPNAFLTLGTLIVCLSSLSLAAVATVALLLSLLFPPENPDGYSHHTQLVQLLLPFPLLITPSVSFSYNLLYGSTESFAAATPLFDIFGPERLNFLIFLAVIAMHLFVSRGAEYSHIQKVDPIAWLTEVFGPSVHSPYYAGASSAGFAGGKGSTKAGPCVHEDGGKFAVFESTEGDPNFDVVDLSPGVTLGTKYRVIYCACYRDTSLKDRSEWCEFCRCKLCGGRFAPKDAADDSSSSSAAARKRGESVNDFSPDLGLLVGLLGLAAGAVVYAGDSAYKHLYLMGMVCFAYLLRDFCGGMMSSISEFVKA